MHEIVRKPGVSSWRALRAVWLCAILISCVCGTRAQTTKPDAAAANSKEKVSLLIEGGTVVTMDASRRVIEDGAIAVRGDTIVAVGPRAELEARYLPQQRVEAQGRLVMPGLINAHAHAAMTLLRGIANDVTLQDWLTNYIFPAEARNVTEPFVADGTRLGVLEMMQSGITTYVDMYYFEDSVASVTKDAGMRAILGETLIDFPAPDNKSVPQALAYTEKYLQHWKGDPLITAAVAPHSIYIASEQTLRSAMELARRYNAPLVIHVAETKKELDDSLAKNQATPVAYLDRIGFLGPDVIAAHCIWVNADDIRLLAEHHTGCVNNPSSNMLLASGVMPVGALEAGGVAVGLGTDGPAGSNNDLDLMREMDLAAKLQKITKMDPRAMTAQHAIEMATIDGARAIHMDSEIGSLEPGKKADLIVLDLDAPHAVPLYNLYAQIVYSLQGSDVRTVVIGGRIVMLDRQALTLDQAEIVAAAKVWGMRVQKSMAAPPAGAHN
ncbi:MAG: amidohydrolase [Candidatus Acidiferrales bacterium]|jgi:5-methylthioadenosine/S-adenosylhomocysteine deaminase